MASSVLHVVGEVVGKQRPRFTTVNGRARSYTPRKTENFESMLRLAYEAQGGVLHHGPVMVTIAYRRVLPKSRPKRVEWEWDVFKPDIDNVSKSVMDALNGVAFEDDKCVVQLTVMKLPRTRCAEEELYVRVSEAGRGILRWMEELWQRFTRLTAPSSR